MVDCGLWVDNTEQLDLSKVPAACVVPGDKVNIVPKEQKRFACNKNPSVDFGFDLFLLL